MKQSQITINETALPRKLIKHCAGPNSIKQRGQREIKWAWVIEIFLINTSTTFPLPVSTTCLFLVSPGLEKSGIWSKSFLWNLTVLIPSSDSSEIAPVAWIIQGQIWRAELCHHTKGWKCLWHPAKYFPSLCECWPHLCFFVLPSVIPILLNCWKGWLVPKTYTNLCLNRKCF